MGRQRVRLVPDDAVEIFEIRIALYFDAQGTRQVSTVVSTPAERELVEVDMIEVIGALEAGRDKLKADYDYDPGGAG